MSNCSCQTDKFEQLSQFIAIHKEKPGALIPVMHEAQDLFGHLPLEVQKFIAHELDVPLSDVYGVATFYSKFTLKAKGKYQINVCMGTACYVKGAQAIVEKIADTLNLQIGETTPDGNFSLEATRCIGACGLAPVMTINDEVYGELDTDQVEKIMKQYLEKVWGDENDEPRNA
ncbi:NADH:ubiquinone oxidoreductase subunit E [Desulfitispora alkaliphila]|uniref:NADH-quinone oxidoreductase subunit NuoE family protein n=1 Tax=Desulfitispora alkaliphila TaxID=622674 RepID=UPI003D1CA963